VEVVQIMVAALVVPEAHQAVMAEPYTPQAAMSALAAVAVGVHQVDMVVAHSEHQAAKPLTLMVIQLLGQAVIQQEFMGVFHDIFG
jgi:hypothetical protein